MDSDNTSVVFVLMAAIFPFVALLLLIGLVVILVRGRRKHWQATATSLGLQSDPMCMYGFRGLPVRIFWRNDGQRVGQLDYETDCLKRACRECLAMPANCAKFWIQSRASRPQ